MTEKEVSREGSPANNELSRGQMQVLSRKMKEIKEQRLLDESHKRLDKIVCTKVRTAFIGALAAFEDQFGFLWGHGLEEQSLSQKQRDMRELWERARIDVLNNGNTQLRALRNEISNHIVKWNRHHIQFVVKPKEKNDE